MADKFKKLITIIIDVVFYERYIMRDAIFRRESRKYVQKILRSIKDVGMILIRNQFDIIYNNLDLELRRDIKKSENFIMINVFLTTFDDNKYE